MPRKEVVQGAAPTGLSSVLEEEMTKTVRRRIVGAVGLLQQTKDIDTPQEQREAFCAMMHSIREEPDAWELAEADPVAFLGKFINDQARSGDAIHLCALVKKLRAVDTANCCTIQTFYNGMIEHGKGRERLSTDLPDKVAPSADPIASPYMRQRIQEWEVQLRFLQALEKETRARVSANAANNLQEYARVLEGKVKVVTALNKKKK